MKMLSGPSGQSVPCRLQRESNELYQAEWQPKEVGEHRVSVTVADAHMPGSPFSVNVLDLSAVRVIGLKDDRVGVEQRFNGKYSPLSSVLFHSFAFSVDSSSAGAGQVTVRVSRQGETLTHDMRMVKEGLHVCTFTPSRVGVHKVHVFLDGVSLPGRNRFSPPPSWHHFMTLFRMPVRMRYIRYGFRSCPWRRASEGAIW